MSTLTCLAPRDPDAPGLTPARALLTPLWIAALAVLIANDHWLKGSGLLPGVITGKLSDVAGLIVAPALLATVLCVRSRQALLACHLAIAAVFAGIQLSPAFAGQWSALMGLAGHPWTITCDPTDLLTLPALIFAWRALLPEMEAGHSPLVPLQRSAALGLSVIGLWGTVATSDIDRGFDPNGTWFQDVEGNVFINNANDVEIALFIRPLRPEIELDCDKVSRDPGRMLSSELFGAAEHWQLPPRTNVPISSEREDCTAAWVAGEGIGATVVFFRIDEHPLRWFPGQSFDANELDPSGMGLVFEGEGLAQWRGGDDLRFVPRDDNPEQSESCEPAPSEQRLDWSPTPAAGAFELLALELGIDGCHRLELQRVTLTAGEPAPSGAPFDWFLCAAEDAVPFAASDRLELGRSDTFSSERGIELILLDPQTLTPAVDDQGRRQLVARYRRGSATANDLRDLVGDGDLLTPEERTDCPFPVLDSCGTAERAVDLSIRNDVLVAGQTRVLDDVDSFQPLRRTLLLSYARERAVLEPGCADGATQLGYDIDIAVIEEPLP